MRCSCRRALTAAAVLLFWGGVWVLAAGLVGRELLLPSPVQVLRRLLELGGTGEFWRTVGCSILRVLTGILSGSLLGILLAVVTERSALLKALFSPVMTLVKSTPVASFIILALIWLGREILPAVISALMVLPVVCTGLWASQWKDFPSDYGADSTSLSALRPQLRPWTGLEGGHRGRGADRTAALHRENDL